MTVFMDRHKNLWFTRQFDDLTSGIGERRRRIFVLMCLLVGAFFTFHTTKMSMNSDVEIAQSIRSLYNFQQVKSLNETTGGNFFQDYARLMETRRDTLHKACK